MASAKHIVRTAKAARSELSPATEKRSLLSRINRYNPLRGSIGAIRTQRADIRALKDRRKGEFESERKAAGKRVAGHLLKLTERAATQRGREMQVMAEVSRRLGAQVVSD